jgi:hypothetical protein
MFVIHMPASSTKEANMKLSTVILASIVSLLLFYPSILHAENFEVDGYKLSLKAIQNDKNLSVAGRIREGPSCESLKIDIFCHSQNGNVAHIVCVVKKVGGKGSRLVRGTDTVYGKGGHWEVSSVFVDCQSN